jgi:hypothetical protein
MTRIIVSEDCGNSPKNNLILQFTIAIARRDVRSVLDSATEHVRWNIVGSQLVEGKENLAEFLKQAKSSQASLVTIHHIASHGKAGAVDGTRKLKNGETLAFCDVYKFGNTKGTMISEIISYVIPIK